MILVTLGTQDKQFSRLLEKLEQLKKQGIISEEIIVQAGCTKFKSENMKIIDMVPIDEFSKLIDSCELLITHGGVGSIITGLRKNKKIIAVPRLKEYKEHENNHQVQIIKKFSQKNYLLDGSELDKLELQYKKIKTQKFNKYKSDSKVKNIIENYIKNN